MLALLFHAAAIAACPQPPVDLHRATAAATEAFARDPDAFEDRHRAIEELLPCLRGPVDPAGAAELHLVKGLYAKMINDVDRLEASFRGLVATAPDFELSPELAPPGSRQAIYFDLAHIPPTDRELVELAPGTWWVDGTLGGEVVRGQAAVVQGVIDEEMATWYLWGESLPPALQPPVPSARLPRHVRLRRWSIGTGAGSIGLWALSAWSKSRLTRGITTEEGYNTLLWTNRIGAVGAPVLGVTSAGLGVGAWVDARR